MIQDFIKNYFAAFIAIVLLIAGLLGMVAFIVATKPNMQPVVVNVVPSDAKVTANGTELKNGTAYLTPGVYSIEVSRGGFKTEKTTILVGDPNTASIDVALTPVSDSAIEWKKSHDSLYYDYEGRVGERAAQEGVAFTALNPITSKLPFENLLYTIGYRADPSDSSGNSIIVEIDASRGYRNAAINEIRNLGYDPTMFKINFRDYESPFENE
jgi:hypothetical protein